MSQSLCNFVMSRGFLHQVPKQPRRWYFIDPRQHLKIGLLSFFMIWIYFNKNKKIIQHNMSTWLRILSSKKNNLFLKLIENSFFEHSIMENMKNRKLHVGINKIPPSVLWAKNVDLYYTIYINQRTKIVRLTHILQIFLFQLINTYSWISH